MAISASKKGNLVDTVLVEATKKDQKILNPKDKIVETETKPEKKSSFISTTIDELRLTSWPKFSYVLRWSVIIILFTALFAVIIGFFDDTFTSSVKFIDCTSDQGRSRDIKECTDDFLKNLTYR